MLKIRILATALMILPSLINPLKAQAQETHSPQRYSIGGGAGINLFLPYFDINLAYRSSILNNRLEFFTEYAYLNVAIGAVPPMTLQAGARYYLWENTYSRTYAQASAGAIFNFNQTNPFGEAVPNSISGAMVQAGVGGEIRVIEHVWLYGNVNLAFPQIFRPGLGLRLTF